MGKYKAVPVNRYQQGREINTDCETSPYNYGLVVSQPENEPFYEAAIDISSEYGIPLAKLALCAIERAVSDDEDYWNGNMPEREDRERLETALETVEFDHQAEIEVGLREAVIERARFDSNPMAPSRMESVFACNSLDDVRRYRAEHTQNRPGTHQECVLEVVKQAASFEGDMHMLDRIDINSMDTDGAMRIAGMYWEGKHTANPLIETILQGRFRFGPPIEDA